MRRIRFHIPYNAPNSIGYLEQVLANGNAATGGKFYQLCSSKLQTKLHTPSIYFTNSCTDALEFAAILANLQAGDEVILPTFTFVSTANAFYLHGCILRFADTILERPNISLETILPLVNARTKVIVVVHYAGIAVDLDPILEYAKLHQILVIEDAAQGIGAKYKNKYLGTIAPLGAMSFHATKLISCGEGGCLFINDDSFLDRASLIFEKGTNRKAFIRNEVSKYEWLDIGSSFGMSEFQAAVLYAQLECLDDLLAHRLNSWKWYMDAFQLKCAHANLSLPVVPEFATINGSFFYIILEDERIRNELQIFLRNKEIESVFHFLALHKSPFYHNKFNQNLPNSEKFESSLLRLPIHHQILEEDVLKIVECIGEYFT
ncbi:MAG: dTDP-4-amino-4,6-dideoxygalactose transaminase [Saprospiraceae bacterium]|nr:dTDP-4-amino-4,6-dideoxygalactose transaminase [Saprospiraceae bacterium]